MKREIAIVGMACQYPDARSPAELWENVLAQRRAFRRLPPERLPLDDYYSADPDAQDCSYATQAALIEGYEFDRLKFRVVGSTFRSADMAHWLALDVAASALEDAGFPDARDLPRETTSVILGNTLTGEFSRANTLRLRWPYVRRVLQAALEGNGWSPDNRERFWHDLEDSYKKPFAPVGDETLAGGLSNTIAGRVCNHFDLKGGGYTVDGACAASLLAVMQAASSLRDGDVDVALAGGVDLSMDPFELVGFSKLGALARDEMRVYDARSAGFWPGEGCGFVVLMRVEDALAQHRRIYALIRGWGVSSDGSGGITRPEVEGQKLALARAYRRAGFGIDSVPYFEGHGTGTAVGDAIELRVLSQLRRDTSASAGPAAIGSIKANIGHTKAAAGMAGLIKATMALHEQVLPPTTGCGIPHPELTGTTPMLRVLGSAECWPADSPLHAGISAMGFGGINTHVVLEGAASQRRPTLSQKALRLSRSPQDAEVFLFGASDRRELLDQLERLVPIARQLARAELADLAATLARELKHSSVRAAVVASSPDQLTEKLLELVAWIDESPHTACTAEESASRMDPQSGVFFGTASKPPRIGFLFPGQGSPAHLNGGAWRRRFPAVDEIYQQASLPHCGDSVATEVAQPAIITACTAGLGVLDSVGIAACAAVGHSLGELCALHWGGAMDAAALLRIATARGRVMSELKSPTGTMAGIRAEVDHAESLLEGLEVVVAGINSPKQTVISGEIDAVAKVVARAEARGMRATRIPVSHAFHSPLVADAAPALQDHLSRETFGPLDRTVVSTITGGVLPPGENLVALLCRQVVSPVRFIEAASTAAHDLDLLIEVGPGEVLSSLVADFLDTPVVPIDAGGPSMAGLLNAVAAAFVLGANIECEALFTDRFTRAFDLDHRYSFFVNPCERNRITGDGASERGTGPGAPGSANAPDATSDDERQPACQTNAAGTLETVDTGAAATTPLEVVRQLIAARAELPPSMIRDDSRLLNDLHLNSISVGQIVVEAARRLALSAPQDPTLYAGATVAELARALDEQSAHSQEAGAVPAERFPPGVDSWIRAFITELVERPLPKRPTEVPSPESSVLSSAPGVALSTQHSALSTQHSAWRVIAAPHHPLGAPLTDAFADSADGSGVVLCLPPEPHAAHVPLLLESARAAMEDGHATRFVLVQHGGGGAAFARTLHLERPDIDVCVVDVPVDHPDAVAWVLAEAMRAGGYSEAHYNDAGLRRVPVLSLLRQRGAADDWPIGPGDVLLVTGGGKGIAAHCALAVARETGVRLALLGRSQPAEDDELAANLQQMADAGLEFRYVVADVTRPQSVRRAVEQVQSELGPVTAFWHAAGVNKPQLIERLNQSEFIRTLAPKVAGAEHVLSVLDADRLKLFVAFGSLIARAGMPGEADYAVANDWLAQLTDRWQADHPHCRCLAIEWSVWTGIGMGERLGQVESLMQRGIVPIPSEEGLRFLRRLICQPPPAVRVVVGGRFGEPPTLEFQRQELPLLRFLERPRVDYPGVEFVAEADLSADTDPYLDDHVLQGERLFPAVMGLEAMAQTVTALTGSQTAPSFKDVEFRRPIVISDDNPTTIRTAALQREDGRIEVVIRSSVTNYQVDHFRATCLLNSRHEAIQQMPIGPECIDTAPLNLVPKRDLYGSILFHSGRFRRLQCYRQLTAKACVAEIASGYQTDWFSSYLPAQLLLGDPACRDAAIHAIQACIPHARLVPIGVDEITLLDAASLGQRECEARSVRAMEVSRDGDTFTYDMEIRGPAGRLLEQWRGLRLKVVESIVADGAWTEALLGPYVERRMEEFVHGPELAIVLERTPDGDRQRRSDHAIQLAVGAAVTVQRGTNGRPQATNGRAVSASHAGDLTLAISGSGPIGCDVEPVAARPVSIWKDLLGPERFALAELIAGEVGECLDTVATRVWSAGECLKKAGVSTCAPMVFVQSTPDGWVLVQSGAHITATYATRVHGFPDRLVVAACKTTNE